MDEKTISLKKRVIKELYFGKLLSCSELSERIEKSFPLTARLINEMIEEGTVIEKGFAASTGGRKPVTFSLKPQMIYVVAVALDQLITKIALMDLNNNYVGEIAKFDLPLADNPKALSTLADRIAKFIDKSPVDKK